MARLAALLAALALLLPAARAAAAGCRFRTDLTIGSFTGPPSFPRTSPTLAAAAAPKHAAANGTGISLLSLTGRGLERIATIYTPITGPNPSSVARTGQYLYTVNDAPLGRLTQIQFRPKKPFISSLRMATGATSAKPASFPVHLTVVDNRKAAQFVRWVILVANAGTGSITIFVKSNRLFYQSDHLVLPSVPSTANNSRTSALPLMVMPYNQSNNLIIPDIKADAVHYLFLGRQHGKIAYITSVLLAPGDGPSNAAIHPNSDTAYVLNQRNPSIAVLRPGCGGSKYLGLCSKIPILPAASSTDMSSPSPYAGAIPTALHVTSNSQFLYIAMRLPDNQPGIIVSYRLDSMSGNIVKKMGTFSSGGVYPSDFAVIDRVKIKGTCRSYLAVVNRESHNLVLLRRSFGSGKLFPNPEFSTNIDSPASILI